MTSDVSLIKSRLTDLATDLDLVAKGVGGMEIRIMDSLQETFKVITTTLAISLQNLEVVQSQV